MTTTDTTSRAPRIDPAWTVNEVLQRHPGTVAVFNAFGIDACCGGASPLSEAARRDGADLDALVAALEAPASGATA